MLKKISNNLNKYYIFFILFYGFTYAIVIPPMYHPDEIRHFQKSINNNFFSKSDEVIITKQSKSFSETFQAHIKKNPFNSFSINFLLDSKSYIWENEDEKIIVDTLWQKNYPNINYFFSKIGVEISKFFTNKIIISYYFGKITNLIFLSLIIFFSINNLKINNQLLLLITVMPMTLTLLSSFNQDSTIIVYTFLLIKLTAHFNYRQYFYTILFFIILYFLVISKISNFFFVIIFFIHLLEAKKINLKLGIPLIIFLYFLILLHYLSAKEVVDPKNLEYVINNPFILFKISFSDFLTNFWTYSVQLVGYLGWINIQVQFWIVIFFILSFFFVIFTNFEITIYKIFILFFIYLSILITQSVIWIYFSQEHEMFVDSLQGRYFIPMLSLFSLILVKQNLNHINSKIKNIILITAPHLNIFSIYKLIAAIYT